MDINVENELRKLHRELLHNCQHLKTVAYRRGKRVVTPINHYARLKEIVKKGGTIVECLDYAQSVVARYNNDVAKHTGKPIPVENKPSPLKIV